MFLPGTCPCLPQAARLTTCGRETSTPATGFETCPLDNYIWNTCSPLWSVSHPVGCVCFFSIVGAEVLGVHFIGI